MSNDVSDDGDQGKEFEQGHVLDLPQVFQKPDLQEILASFAKLKVLPPSWDKDGSSDLAAVQSSIYSHGVVDYLVSYVSSSLKWLKDDEEREQVWDLAAARLAERSGRTGVGAWNRTFKIPTWGSLSADDRTSDEDLELVLHEPSITEDNLGLKTWASAYVLARKGSLFQTLYRDIFRPYQGQSEVLELGSGTGLVGMTLAAMLRLPVLLSDLPAIVGNLRSNVSINQDKIISRGGMARVAALDWRNPESVKLSLTEEALVELPAQSLASPLVVAADPIYDREQPSWLAQTISFHLSRNSVARAVVTIAVREGFETERTDFAVCMDRHGLVQSVEEFDEGYDDWQGSANGERSAVRCWTSVWKWNPSKVGNAGP